MHLHHLQPCTYMHQKPNGAAALEQNRSLQCMHYYKHNVLQLALYISVLANKR